MKPPARFAHKHAFRGLALLALAARCVYAQQAIVLDRVVAVVNNRAILESDLREEMRVAVLEPPNSGGDTPQEALQRLIRKTLIRQQVRSQFEQDLMPSKEEVAVRLTELRKELPICVSAHCTTDEGWKAFLAAHGLREREVERYVRERLGLLRFIEQRFRQGIQIGHDEVEAYYMNRLVPEYLPGQTVPPLEEVAPRIEEILLQQKVNALFSDWLDSLRKQGEVEVLDPALEAPSPKATGAGAP
jgi:peptidyl-prolyl cis-trans isomerase SurA